jgi:hypothetical protein
MRSKTPNALVARHFSVCAGVIGTLSGMLWLLAIYIRPNAANGFVILHYLLPLVVQVYGLSKIYMRMKDDDSNPPPQQSKALKTFALFYFWTMAICFLGYSGLSVFYISGESGWSDVDTSKWQGTSWLNYVSVSALCLILVLLYRAVKMTQAIVSGTLISNENIGAAGTQRTSSGGSTELDLLKTGAAYEPFVALLFFFTVFLGVSYLFGLSLAFHDKYKFHETAGKMPALYMKSLYAAAPASPAATTPAATADDLFANKGSEAVPYVFRFESAQALLSLAEPPVLEGLSENEAYYQKKSRKEKGGVYVVMSDLVDKIISLTEGQKRVRVEIIGHSDPNDLQKRSYNSNHELAVARAENTKYKIIKELSFRGKQQWRDIEWLTLSESSEGRNNARITEVFVKPIPHDPIGAQMPQLEAQVRPLVEAEKPNSLSLMDYIYFANYTITTTGYGDIIPITPYAKFICSFANICEVFFLVVLFNTLLSLKDGKGELNAADHNEVRLDLSEEDLGRIISGIKSANEGTDNNSVTEERFDGHRKEIENSIDNKMTTMKNAVVKEVIDRLDKEKYRFLVRDWLKRHLS